MSVLGTDLDKMLEMIKDNIINEKKDIQNVKTNAMDTFFQNVMNDSSIDYYEKWKFIESLNDLQKSKNLIKIVGKAFKNQKHLGNDDFTLSAISEDWILDYFDKVKNVSSDSFQGIWSAILETEAETPGKISKKLLHTLYLMDCSDAESFVNLSKFCFADAGENHKEMYHPIVMFKQFNKDYSALGMSYEMLEDLENLGLIITDFNSGFCFHFIKKLYYKDKFVEITSQDKINAGNVKLTKIGQSLMNSIHVSHNDAVFRFTIERWQLDNCRLQVNNKFYY